MSFLHISLFVSSVVLIGGSRSLPLASWLTFGLSCVLSLLYRWWALATAPPTVCADRHCPDSRSLLSLSIRLPVFPPVPPPLRPSPRLFTHPFYTSCLDQHQVFLLLSPPDVKPTHTVLKANMISPLLSLLICWDSRYPCERVTCYHLPPPPLQPSSKRGPPYVFSPPS